MKPSTLANKANEHLIKKWKENPNHPAVLYLKNRGLDISDVRKFKLGWMENSSILKDLKKCIIIPIIDEENRVISFIGRKISDDEQPKYKLSSAFPFNKSATLFNINNAIESRRHSVYVVEGPFDAIMLDKKGYPAVALLGALFSKQMYEKLYSYFPTIVIALDNDIAGYKSMLNIYKRWGDTLKFALPKDDDKKDYGENTTPRWTTIEEIALRYYRYIRKKTLIRSNITDEWVNFVLFGEGKAIYKVKDVRDIINFNIIEEKIDEEQKIEGIIELEIRHYKKHILSSLGVRGT